MSLQQKTETNIFWLLLFTVLTISVGALVEIVPLFY